MKLLLSNIVANWNLFEKESNGIGFEYKKTNISSPAKTKSFLVDLIENIQAYNDIINIFDYTPEQKKAILNFIDKLGYKKTTFIDNLYNKNMENHYEDGSIEDDYSDAQLFESLQLKAQENYRIKSLNENLYFDTNKNPNLLHESINFDDENDKKDNIETAKNFLKTLKEFEAAHNKMVNDWHSIDSKIIDELGAQKYPFESSFDEYDIEEWRSNFENKLKEFK